MKKLFAKLLALVMVLSLAACAGNGDSKDDSTKDSASDSAKDSEKESESQSAEPVELVVFAAASLTESLTAIGEKYMADNQNVKLSFNFSIPPASFSPRSRKAPCATCSSPPRPSR